MHVKLEVARAHAPTRYVFAHSYERAIVSTDCKSGNLAVSQIDAKSKTPQIVLLAWINDVILEKYDRWIVLLRNINKTTDLSSCRVTLLLTIAVFKKVCDRLVVFMGK